MEQYKTDFHGIDSVSVVKSPVPKISSTQVLIKVLHVSLNFRDLEVVQGLYSHHKTVDNNAAKPIVPCSDMHGTVVEIGSEVKQWAVGDKVLSIFAQTHLHGQLKESDLASGLGLPLDGVFSQYVALEARALVAPPKHLSSAQACTLTVAGVTAYTALFGLQKLEAGQTVLIQGTGGVSMQAVLLALVSGARVILTSSSDDKLAKAKKLGVQHGINYRTTPDWHDEVMKITNGLGVEHIIENGSRDTLMKSFNCVAFGGQISLIGYLSGKEPSKDGEQGLTVLAIKRNVTLKGLLNGSRDNFLELVELYDKHKIVPDVDRVFAWNEVQMAMKYMWNGSHFGKVVIKVQD